MTRVYLAVGHGRRSDGTWDPGATRGSATEQNEGRPIVAAMAAELSRVRGVTLFSEEDPGDPNFPGTVRQANAWGADLLVSVHHDWQLAPRGAFGHWWPGNEEGKRLADALLDAVAGIGWPLRRDWHKARSDLYLLRHTDATAVLWEADRIGEVAGRHEEYGQALAAGVAAFLGKKVPARRAPATSRVKEHPLAKFEDSLAAIAANSEKSVRLQQALVAGEVGNLRVRARLSPDPASDAVWAERIAAGDATREDAWEELLDKAEAGDG